MKARLMIGLMVLILGESFAPLWAVTAGATRQEVLVVVNQASPSSLRIGEYYSLVRGIPKSNICAITCPTTESISIATYLQQIASPIADFLTTHQLRDQIKYIVTTKGVPLRMMSADRWGSVDSALSLLFSESACGRAATGIMLPPFQGAIPNPYFSSNDAFAAFKSTAEKDSSMEAFPQIRDLALLPGGGVVAVGNKGLIVCGSAGTWTVVDDRRKNFSQSNFTSVFFASATEGWAVTDDGRALRTTNAAQDWTKIRGVSTERYTDVALASSSEGWVVGESVVSSTQTQPLILHYLNSSWTAETTGLTSGTLLSVTAPENAHVWACGSNGVILRRTNGVWSRLTNGVPNTTYRSIAILYSNSQYQGWAVGDGGVVLHTTDGGDTWTQQSSGVTGRLSQVTASNSNDAWITRDWQQAGLLKTSNAGSAWANNQMDHNGKNAVAFSDTLNGYAVGNDAATGRFGILRTTDGGVTWPTAFTGPDTQWRLSYLVCRLDGYSEDTDKDGLPDDVKAIIDRAKSPDPTGAFVLDVAPTMDYAGYRFGNDQIREARTLLTAAGRSVVSDEYLGAPTTYMTGQWLLQRLGYTPQVAGYCSWGSNDNGAYNSAIWARPGFTWRPGAIAMTCVSTDGRTYDKPDFLTAAGNSLRPYGNYSNPNVVHVWNIYPDWRFELHDSVSGLTYSAVSTGLQASIDFSGSVTSGYLQVTIPDPESPASFIPLPGARLDASVSQPITGGKDYALTTPQSLSGDLLHEGCSGVIGNVYEPYLDATGCPDQVMPKYAEGFTWAESAYAGLRYLAWQEVVIGDPLMAPYAPVVKITSPKKGTSVSGSITVTADATDPQGVNRVELLLDGVSIGSLTAIPYQWTINTSQGAIADGKHDLEVAAYRDSASGVSFRGYDSAQILVSNTAPIKLSGEAVTLPDTTTVTINNAVATVDSSAFPAGIYLEHPMRTSAIRITLPTGEQVYEGDVLSARGAMSTLDGERVLVASEVVYGEWTAPLKPLGIAGVRIGGRSPISEIPTLTGSSGVYNVGLLVRLIGRVMPGGSDFFYLDDGSGSLDNSGTAGIKIKCGALTMPTSGFVAVAGIAGTETIGGGLARVIRVRKQEDIVQI